MGMLLTVCRYGKGNVHRDCMIKDAMKLGDPKLAAFETLQLCSIVNVGPVKKRTSLYFAKGQTKT